MKFLEKKYRVESFDEIKAKLSSLGLKLKPTVKSQHYYAVQDSLDATKLVVGPEKAKIQILKENNGKFELTDNIEVEDKQAGLKWMKDHGFYKTARLNMEVTSYDYKDGTISLYKINDDLLSVILYFPTNQLLQIESLLELSNQEVIDQPYNKYIEK